MEVKGGKREVTRKRIMNAAKAHFIDFGFKDTLMSDIAAYLHMDRRTIYRYFSTKESLLIHITAQEFDGFTREVLDFKFDLDDDASNKLRKLFNYYYEYIKSNPNMIILLGMVDMSVGTNVYDHKDFLVLDQHGKRLDKVLESIIQEGQDEGIFNTKQTARDYAVTINNSLIAMATRTGIYVPKTILKQEGYTWNLLLIQGRIMRDFLLVKND